MRRVTAGVGGIYATEVERPVPGPGEALVRTRLVGICGSDVHAVAGRHPFVSLPYNPGHEVVGVVAGIGAAVDALRIGDPGHGRADLAVLVLQDVRRWAQQPV